VLVTKNDIAGAIAGTSCAFVGAVSEAMAMKNWRIRISTTCGPIALSDYLLICDRR
jgi:hypothetical protein